MSARQAAYSVVLRVFEEGTDPRGGPPVRNLAPPVRAALRLGAYQLGFAEGIPRHAAVNETVELVRGAGLERAVPFTNAVMHRLADGIRRLLAALPERTRAEAALKHSYPDWIAELWWNELG